MNNNDFDYNQFLEVIGLNTSNIGMNSTADMNNNNQLYGSYEGYIKGNLFKNLYSEYKNYKPMRFPVNSEEMELLLNLNQLHFAMHEINLYLDVFPNDINAMREFDMYRDKYNRSLNEYESKYGPLNVFDERLNNVPFAWENESFPWEGGIQ